MNPNHYMELILCILNHTTPSEETISSTSMEEIYDFAALNKLTPLMVNALSYLPITSDHDKEWEAYWKNEAIGIVFGEYQKFALVKKLTLLADARNLPLILFKGYILADLYPSFTMRTSSDTDLLVSPSDFERAAALLEELHYSRVPSLDTDNVYTYIYQEAGRTVHKIELHTSLFEDMQGSQIAYLESLDLASPTHNISIECCGITMHTMNHQAHLIYQIFHMVKHLCFHGLPIRYMIDIALFIRKYFDVIDWPTFETVMQSLGYTRFWQHFASLMIQYFEVPAEILGTLELCAPEETTDLLVDMLGFGMRSRDKEISRNFYYFERYLEKLETETNQRLNCISFDGKTVPTDIVPIEMQQNELLQGRIRFLQNLELL